MKFHFLLLGLVLAASAASSASSNSSRVPDIVCSDGRNRFEVSLFARDVILLNQDERQPHAEFQSSLSSLSEILVVASGPDIEGSPLSLTVPSSRQVQDSLSRRGVFFPGTDENERRFVEGRIPLAYNRAQHTSGHGESLSIRFNLVRSGQFVESYSLKLNIGVELEVVPGEYRGHSCRTRANLLPRR